MKTFQCEYPVYVIKVYAIKQTIFFTYAWFCFGIPESYAIKQIMHLLNMQLTGVVCNLILKFSDYFQ